MNAQNIDNIFRAEQKRISDKILSQQYQSAEYLLKMTEEVRNLTNLLVDQANASLQELLQISRRVRDAIGKSSTPRTYELDGAERPAYVLEEQEGEGILIYQTTTEYRIALGKKSHC